MVRRPIRCGRISWPARTMGQGYRQYGQNLVPQWRRRIAAGGGARPRSPPRPTASSPPAPIRAVWSRSRRRRTPRIIPIINFNTPDPKATFTAYVGGDNVVFGRHWAQYLVDHKLVKAGDFVWMPVEVPGATYGVQEEQGIAAVFKPLGITWEVTDATLDQAKSSRRMSDYLTANHKKINAIIGLGDLVHGSIKRVFDQVGVKAGRNSGRRLGQLARHHAGSQGRLRHRRAVAGSAGDQLCRALPRGDGGERHPARLQRHHSARSMTRPMPTPTTRSCRASRARHAIPVAVVDSPRRRLPRSSPIRVDAQLPR